MVQIIKLPRSNRRARQHIRDAAGDGMVVFTPVLDKALTLSTDRVGRMAEAFGLKVQGVAPKPEKTCGSAAGPRRATKA